MQQLNRAMLIPDTVDPQKLEHFYMTQFPAIFDRSSIDLPNKGDKKPRRQTQSPYRKSEATRSIKKN